MEKKKIYLVLTLVFIVLFIAVCLIDLFLENLEKKQELLLKVLEIISASSISFTLSCTISIKKSNRNNKTKVSLIATIAISLVFFSYKYVLDAIIKYSFMI